MIKTEKAVDGGMKFQIHPDFTAAEIKRQLDKEPELLSEMSSRIANQHYELNELVMMKGLILYQMERISSLESDADDALKRENNRLLGEVGQFRNEIKQLRERLDNVRAAVLDTK